MINQIRIIDNKIAKHLLNIEQLKNRKMELLSGCNAKEKYNKDVFLSDFVNYKKTMSYRKVRELLVIKYGEVSIPGITQLKNIHNKL